MHSEYHDINKGTSFRFVKKLLFDIRKVEQVRSDKVKNEVHDDILCQLASVRRKKLVRKIYLYTASVAAVLFIVLAGINYFSSTHEKQFRTFAAKVIDSSLHEIVILSENGSSYKIDNNSQIICNPEGGMVIRGEKQNIEISDNSTLYKVVVPDGRRTSVALQDGSNVTLNSGSVFTFPKEFTDKERTVHISGEGFFRVNKNQRLQQFMVMTEHIRVCVLGTNFDVISSPEKTEVVLVKGSIAIESQIGKELVRLVPGEMYTTDNWTFVKEKTDVDMHTCWVDNIMQINNLPLTTVVDRLSAYYKIRITIIHDNGNKTINGKLDLTNPIEEIVRTLSVISGAKLSVDGEISSDIHQNINL